ncbi:hypothetical protein [Bdellovibrio sp. HCB337]|uniref:hypothetical protein n=1 Tax=Bdellovibrio sp. HCB337 TaxID=3394358 RepID=UPI0039A71640
MNPQVPEKDSLTLKHYFQVGIGLGLFVAIVAGIFWFKSGSNKESLADTEEISEPAEDSGADTRLDEDLAARMEASPTPDRKKNDTVDMNKASEFFGQSIKHLSTCLGINASAGNDRVDPSFESLAAIVKPDLGDPIMRSEDWVTWNMRAGSEERRIRIETDYSDSEKSSRHLLYFKLDAQGQPTLIPLPSEQTKDPSDTFIASLQKDGEVYEEEKGQRAYFDNGQEMVLTEKNGKIDDLEFSNGAKTFRCAGILTSAPSCKCY